MSVCSICDQEMLTSDGCVQFPLPTDGGLLNRIPYGEEVNQPYPVPGQLQHGVRLGDPPRCHDCGALPGHFHHLYCDIEECPHCHQQAIGCPCDPPDEPEEVIQ